MKDHKDQNAEKSLSLKTLSKSNVWDLQENDIFRIWEECDKDADLRENTNRYLDNVRSAFDVEIITNERPDQVQRYEARGFVCGELRIGDSKKSVAIKKHPITKITDLTYENIRHISVNKLLEVIDNNFGGGWDSISQSIKDIIESGFDISTSTMPKKMAQGGMYRKKIADGFEVLQIEKGNWVESIFAKVKPLSERLRYQVESRDDDFGGDEDDEDEDEVLPKHNTYDDEDDDEEEMTEENYHTTFSIEEEPDGDLSGIEEDGEEEY